jgi:hypothetical protein
LGRQGFGLSAERRQLELPEEVIDSGQSAVKNMALVIRPMGELF